MPPVKTMDKIVNDPGGSTNEPDGENSHPLRRYFSKMPGMVESDPLLLHLKSSLIEYHFSVVVNTRPR
jgi:hypothetical protein